jgi:putative ABC transport system permease protein
MSFWTLVQAELWRRPERTVFTIVSLVVGFFLFGLLQGVNAAFGTAMAQTHADRLMVGGRFGNSMPLADLSQIERLPGVKQVTWLGLLPAYYRDPKLSFLILASDPARFFSVMADYKISAVTLNRFVHTRTGLIVDDKLAKRFGLRVGDQVNLNSPVVKRDGSRNWTFDIVGLVSSPKQADPPFAVMNYTYLDENRADARGGMVQWFYVQAVAPERAVAVGRSIDSLFVNSSAPTFSQQESAFAAQSVADIGDAKLFTDSIIVAVFFAMLFVTGNVIFESVRERTSELAVLKTFGYSDTRVLMLIELEALTLCLSGAIAGLTLAALAFHFVGRVITSISSFLATTNTLSARIILTGLGFAVILTFVAAAIPAWSAKRLTVAHALRMRA